MIDLHSHILPKVDDGSSSMERTMQILKEAKEAGFSAVVSTSHYMEGYYEVDEENRFNLLEEIQDQCEDLDLYLGSEVYYSENMIDLLDDRKASTINDSRYVLFEFSLTSKPLNAKDLIYRIIECDYIPIVAHPERYEFVQKDIEFVRELAQMGALFQANYGSIIGMYGGKAQKTVKKLLKEDLISFFGSDVHRPNQVYPKMDKIIKALKKIISEEKFEELSDINPRNILQDIEI